MCIFGKLKKVITKTSSTISSGIDRIFLRRKLDEESLLELEELLISSDMNASFVVEIIKQLSSSKFDKNIDNVTIKERLSQIIIDIMSKSELNLDFDIKKRPNIILVCGVNGSGKTTTIGKLSNYYVTNGKKVVVAACDTFRAAAIAQLESWVTKANAIFITGGESSDPASVAYKAVEYAINNDVDMVFIDTAGRLHNHKNLMDELAKIIKVIRKLDISAPHHSLLVVDSTTGQNLYNQVEQFKSIADINGLIVTKLDGTAKAGALVGVVQKFNTPIYFTGIGEKIEDFRIFDVESFARSLLGL